ncbi:hypothetical protein P691DRAFT_800097 [Macrolepiota fuliginosa MF-IS2]|uniref:F-box domain-containing protein n=1 Tax=Macrolepiota fuliginosa MF-IS2 TaxID=1400762 RepID=A0A9P5XQG0_9AGAR|nr:hypothetical protein P691DRAFT_800097 [Macrolepiota fuliginosa MF-IS2]
MHVSATTKPSQLPILPPDILIEIFATRPSGMLFDEHAENIPPLAASVCYYWRDVVLSSPAVWTNVTASTASTYDPDLYLQRSSPYPFNLYLYFDGVSTSAHFIRAFSRALHVHYQRLDELFIFYRARDQTLGSEFLPGLHALGPLNISVLWIEAKYQAPWPSPPAGQAITLAAASMPNSIMFPPTPKLIFCKLPVVWITLITHTLPSLKTLWITECHISRFAFCKLAQGMPALRTLILEDVEQRAPPLHGGDRVPSVTLSSLSVLVIHFHWHPTLSKRCHCLLGSIIAPNLEVLELKIRFEVDSNEEELLEFHETALRQWRRPESPLQKIVFRGILDPWHKGIIHIVRLLRKPLHVEFKGFKGKVLSASPVKGDLVADLEGVMSLSLDFTQLMGQDIFEALCRLRQMVGLLLPSCPPITVWLGEEMREHPDVLELRQTFEKVITFHFGFPSQDEYWNIPNKYSLD